MPLSVAGKKLQVYVAAVLHPEAQQHIIMTIKNQRLFVVDCVVYCLFSYQSGFSMALAVI